jgi:hypothetical protein
MPDRLVYPLKAVQWKGVELLPGRAVDLPLEKNSNHYYGARNGVGAASGLERECSRRV